MKLSLKQKYELYQEAVQSVDFEVDFLQKIYKKTYQRAPSILREDFSGSSALSLYFSEKTKMKAYAIDLDSEPLEFARLKGNNTKVIFRQENVLETKIKAELIVAFNFSYCIFKERFFLLNYFKNVKKTLLKEGLFLLDFFFGPEAYEVGEESKKLKKNNKYYWACESYNALTGEGVFSIHFLVDSQLHKRVFRYDWRLWQPFELKDLLLEAGFSEISFYIENEQDRYVLKNNLAFEGCQLGYLIAR